MWQDALRVCKEYIPHKLQHLQDEYEREMADKGGQRWEKTQVGMGYLLKKSLKLKN